MKRLLASGSMVLCACALVATGCKRVSSETGEEVGGGGASSTATTSSEGGSGGSEAPPWSPTSSDTSEQLHGVWAGASSRVIAVGDSGTVIISDDGGDSWSGANSGVTAALKSVWSVGGEIYAVGDGGVIVHSSDDGQTFVSEDSGVTNDLDSVWAHEASNVFASGSSGLIIRSTDGGSSWVNVPNAATGRVTGLWGIDASNLFAVGEALWLWSSDGGDSWDWAGASLTMQNDLFATGHNHVFIVNSGGTITRWDGAVWHKSIISPKREHHGVWGPDGQDVFVVGHLGAILHTSTGGEDWSHEDSGTDDDLNDVFGASGRVYAVGENGTVLIRALD